MSNYKTLKKEELKSLADELGLKYGEGARIIDLKVLIESSDIFKNDPEFVVNATNNILQVRTQESLQQEHLIALEKLKIQRLQAELELANVKKSTSEEKAENEASRNL